MKLKEVEIVNRDHLVKQEKSKINNYDASNRNDRPREIRYVYET